MPTCVRSVKGMTIPGMIHTDPYDLSPAHPQDRSGTVALTGIGNAPRTVAPNGTDRRSPDPDAMPTHPAPREGPGTSALPGEPARHALLDPATELGRLMQRREAFLQQESVALKSLRAYLDRLANQLHGGPPRRAEAPPTIETLSSTEDISARVDSMLGAAQSEVLILDRMPRAQGTPGSGEIAAVGCRHLRPLLARGVTVQTITDRGAMDFPDKRKALTLLTELGLQARIGLRLPTSMLLVDRRTCLLPVPRSTDAIEPALVFGDSLLRQAVLPLFESLWGRATPVGNADGPLTPPQRELLGLLASGLKDESIARRLGVHVHTARRRITHLLGELDADTRFQAGVQAASRGWLRQAPEA